MFPQLGAVLALTGPEAPYARQLWHALALAVHDVPWPLAFRIEDDHATPARAREAAARLADNPRVVAAIGPMNSWTCEEAAAVFAEAGLPHITPSASNVALARRGWPTFFRACPNDTVQARALADVAARLAGATSVAAVDDLSNFAAPLGAEFLASCQTLGLASYGQHGVDHGSPGTTLALEALGRTLAEFQPDVVLIAGLEDACRASALTLRAHGVRGTFVGTDGIKPTRALWVDGHPAVWLTNSGTDAAERAPAFHDRMLARAGTHASIYTVETYDAALLLATLVAEGADTREAMAAALGSGRRFDGLSGNLAFDARGERLFADIGVYRDEGLGPRFVGTAASLVAA
ncbi:MAG: ABC transporter substrate-binding protein [Acidobacteria bacterium]|nr:ABC transporter substrate-binding protein [Acidobacteriota bacterium]